MGEYVQLPDVKTWYEADGQGEPLVLLHGGLVTNETWGPMRPGLVSHFHVFLPERRAHGHTPDVKGPLTYAAPLTFSRPWCADPLMWLVGAMVE